MAKGTRFLDVILRASNRRLKSDLRASQREVQGFANRTRDLLRSGFAAGIGGFAGFASAQGLAELGRGVLDTEEALTRIGIQAGISDQQIDKVRKTAQETGRAFGLSTSKVVEAATAIVNLEGAAGFSSDKMQVLAKASVATGAELTDLAGIGFALGNAFNTKSPEELAEALSAVTEAGKNGSIPLNEMSTVLQQISVNFSKVGASGKDGAADLAAALQVVRTGFGSASEAGTGLKAFIAQLEQNSDKFKKHRVHVTRIGKDGKERLRPLRDILDDIGKSKILDTNKAKTELFGSQEARQFLERLIEGRKLFEELSEAARKSNSVQEDSQRFLNSSIGRLKISIAEAQGKLEALFTPERIELFVGVVQNQLVPALDFVLEHARAIGIAIVGWKLAQAGKAAAGFALALGKGVKQAGGLSGVFGAMGGTTGGILRTIIGFAGPIGIATAAVWALSEAFSGARKESEKLTEEQRQQAELAGKIVGTISTKDVQGRADARRKRAKELRSQVEESDKLLFSSDFDRRVQDAATPRVVGKGTRAPARISGAEAEELKGLQDAFRRQRGVIDSDQRERLEALLKKSGLLKEFAGGDLGRSKLAEAERLELDARAIEQVGDKSYGRRDFRAEGFDAGKAADDLGIDESQRDAFQRFLLRELGKVSGGAQLRLGAGGAQVTGLAVNDSGRVVRSEAGDGLAGRIQTATRAVQAVASGNVQVSEHLVAKLDEMIATLAANAERPISVQVDGKELVRTIADSPEHRRSPR